MLEKPSYLERVGWKANEALTRSQYKYELSYIGDDELVDKERECEVADSGAGLIMAVGFLTSCIGKGADRFLTKRMTGRRGTAVHATAKTLEMVGMVGSIFGTVAMAHTVRDVALIGLEEARREESKDERMNSVAKTLKFK